MALAALLGGLFMAYRRGGLRRCGCPGPKAPPLTTTRATDGAKVLLDANGQPTDWEVVKTPDGLQTYYWNRQTGGVTWEMPLAAGGSQPTTQPPGAGGSQPTIQPPPPDPASAERPIHTIIRGIEGSEIVVNLDSSPPPMNIHGVGASFHFMGGFEGSSEVNRPPSGDDSTLQFL